MNEEKDKGPTLLVWGVLLPLILLSAIMSLVAWGVALLGGRYRTIKWLSCPAWLLASNCIGMLFIIPVTFVYGTLTHHPGLAGYFLQNVLDLTGFVVWGRIVSWFWDAGVTNFDPDIPGFQVILFQLVLYATIGHRLARQWTCALIDSANQLLAQAHNWTPTEIRETRKKNDAGYEKAALFYANRGKTPFLSIVTICLSGGNPITYFATDLS